MDIASTKLLSVVILTYNEEANLPICIASLAGLDAAVFVVDSGSTDRTVEIASNAGCRVFHHPFESQAAQLNWALQSLPIKTPWVIRLDADERLTAELVAELGAELISAESDIAAFEIKRRVYFWGRWIRHGGYYPIWLLRVWRAGSARCEQRWMDEHMLVSSGRIARLRHDFIDENQKGLSFWTDKHNRYADREVRDVLASAQEQSSALPAGQMGRRRWLKQKLYARGPLFLRAFLYWFFRYFILFGFLDGKPGLVFHFLQAFWYRLLVDAKLYEAGLARAAASGKAERSAEEQGRRKTDAAGSS